MDGVGPVTITYTNTPDAGDADAVAKAIARMLNDIPQLRAIAQRLVDNAIEKLKTQGEVDPGTANLIRLNVLETLADDLKARGAGRFAIKRAGNIIEGYQKTNLKEVLKDYIDGWSGMMTKQDAALEFLEELKEIPRNKPQLMAYASKYAQDMLRNQEPMDRISAKMRSIGLHLFPRRIAPGGPGEFYPELRHRHPVPGPGGGREEPEGRKALP